MEINHIKAIYLCRCNLFHQSYNKHLSECKYMLIPAAMVKENDTPVDVIKKVNDYLRFKSKGDIIC